MKKLLILSLFVLPLSAFCQCPKWVADAGSVTGLVAQHLQITVKPSEQPITEGTTEFVDSTGALVIRIWPTTNQIYIKGASGKVDALFTALQEQVKGCEGYTAGGQWVRFSKRIMVWEKARPKGEVEQKTISIRMDAWAK